MPDATGNQWENSSWSIQTTRCDGHNQKSWIAFQSPNRALSALPSQKMALARSASGPGGLSINTGAANLL
jgi:hypothetical protein